MSTRIASTSGPWRIPEVTLSPRNDASPRPTPHQWVPAVRYALRAARSRCPLRSRDRDQRRRDQVLRRALDSDHGAPARLVSPSQYGYISTKHLCRIDLHIAEPKDRDASPIRQVALRLVKRQARARVWEEERHRHLPAWSVRRVYRLLIPPIKVLSARGSRRTRAEGQRGH